MFSFIKFLLSKGTRNVEAAWKALKTGNEFFYEMRKNLRFSKKNWNTW